MAYFLICGGEDGVQILQYDDQEDLQKEIEDCEDAEFIPLHKFDKDTMEWGTFVLIEGEVIIPKPKQVVKRWELP